MVIYLEGLSSSFPQCVTLGNCLGLESVGTRVVKIDNPGLLLTHRDTERELLLLISCPIFLKQIRIGHQRKYAVLFCQVQLIASKIWSHTSSGAEQRQRGELFVRHPSDFAPTPNFLAPQKGASPHRLQAPRASPAHTPPSSTRSLSPFSSSLFSLIFQGGRWRLDEQEFWSHG